MSIMSGDVPMIGTPLRLEVARELERRLPAVLHDHAPGLLDVHDLEHVLERQRLEVQAVGGVVVGRHGLRVAVDHDGLVAVLAQRHRRVHAAVVELDALPDAVRAAAQHDHLLAVGRLGLALLFVRRVHVRGARRELGRAGVDALVHGPHAERVPARADVVLLDLQQVREPAVGEARALELAQLVLRQRRRACAARARSSRSTISLICARNHGSIFVCRCISSTDMPMPNASATYHSRSARG